MNILLIDDNHQLLESNTKLLRSCGHEVEAYLSPKSALLGMKRDVYDILIVDYNLGDTNGIEFIKDFSEFKMSLRTYLCTGFIDSELKETVKNEFKFLVEIIHKPIDFTQLQGIL